MSEKYLDKIIEGLDKEEDKEKIDLIKCAEGIVKVDAGPGTGKTTAMVARYCHLVLDKKVEPEEIIMLTFTNKAAAEMNEKLRKKLRKVTEDEPGIADKIIPRIKAKTFDSLFQSIVREYSSEVEKIFSAKLPQSASLITDQGVLKKNFMAFLENTIRDGDYGDHGVIAMENKNDFYKLINKMMAYGIIPESPISGNEIVPWAYDEGIIFGREGLKDELKAHNGGKNQSELFSKIKKIDGYKELFDLKKYVNGNKLSEAAIDEVLLVDKDLIKMVMDVYFGFIRQSITEGRMSFALYGLLAFAILYHSGGSIKKCKHMIIDEFQDTNPLQMMASMMLVSEKNFCVVGDWKQSIYGFRFSTVDNLRRFAPSEGGNDSKFEEFARVLGKRTVFEKGDEIQIFQLENNYRSEKTILDCAFNIFRVPGNNDEKIDEPEPAELGGFKPMKDFGDNHHVRFLESDSDDETEFAVSVIEDYLTNKNYKIKDAKPKPENIAVLCRSKVKCKKIHEALEKRGIPSYLNVDFEIMSEREGKLALFWLKYVCDAEDVEALSSIMIDLGYPLVEILSVIDEKKIIQDRVPGKIKTARDDLSKMKDRPAKLLTVLFSMYDGIDDNTAQAVVNAVSEMSDGMLFALSDIIASIENSAENKTEYPVENSIGGGAVAVMTMHKAKGLEFDIVVIPFVDSGSTPSKKRDDSTYTMDKLSGIRCKKEIAVNGYRQIVDNWKTAVANYRGKKNYDEERRLFFVALSRAKQYLTVISKKGRGSKFFSEERDDVPGVETEFSDFCTGYEPEESKLASKPVIESIPEKPSISVHKVIGYDPDKGKGEGKGRGTAFGNLVHEYAEKLFCGEEPEPPENAEKEAEYIRSVKNKLERNGVKSAVAEYECHCLIDESIPALSGKIDLYAEFGDRVEIHDWKTDGNKGNLDAYRMQLSIYVRTVSEVTKKKTVCFVHYVSLEETVEFEPMTWDEIRNRAREELKKADKN